MVDDTATAEDVEVIRGILLSYKAEGIAIPLVPLDVDLDGDGIVDAYGLDANDQVIIVSGAPLENTVYVSEGDDAIEHEAEV